MFEPHQVLHRNRILATGVTGPELTELVAIGAITRLWRGWYTMGEPIGRPDPRGVTRSMRVLLSHQSAAAWYGVDLTEPVDYLHVTAPRNRGRRALVAPGIRLHRRDVVPAEIRRVRDIRCTSPNRTIADLARSLRLAQAVAIADGFIRLRLTTQSSLVAYAGALAKGSGRPAVRRAAALVDGTSGSIFESLTRVILVEAGLPRPCTQFNVRDSRLGWIGRVDFAWPEARVVLECDGYEFHSDRRAFEADRRRWSSLTRAGWQVATVTWSQVMSDPGYVVDLVGDLLGVSGRSSTQLAR